MMLVRVVRRVLAANTESLSPWVPGRLPWLPGSCLRAVRCCYCTRPGPRRVFPVLDGAIDATTTDYKENFQSSETLIGRYLETLAVAKAGGGQKGIDRHVKYNKKITAWDRLRMLFDDYDSVLEVAPLAGMGMEYGNVPRAGVLAAIGKIHGVYCMVSATDATVKAGTMFPISVKKQLRMQEISEENHLPFVFLIDSGGAFLPLQAEIFTQGGRTFYNEAILNSKNIPQLAIVCGSCTAGAAYIPTMVQESIIVHKIGTIFLAGPPLVKAALGEEISSEDLGGATIHCNVSGYTDHFATTEEEAYAMGRDVVATFNIEPSCSPEAYDEPLYDATELPGIIPAKHQHNMNPYQVIARLTDGSRFHEFKKNYGKSLVTGFAHLQGHLVGIVIDNGVTTEQSALKGAHFVQLCDQRRVPVIFLQNTTPQDLTVSTEEQAILFGARIRGEAKMMAAVACVTVPKLSVIIGNSIGSYTMGCRAFSPSFLFTWPNAQVTMEDPRNVVSAILESKGSNDKESREKITKEVMLKTSAIFMASRHYSDGIILPQDTRKVLGQCLEIVSQHQPQKETQYSVIRM